MDESFARQLTIVKKFWQSPIWRSISRTTQEPNITIDHHKFLPRREKLISLPVAMCFPIFIVSGRVARPGKAREIWEHLRPSAKTSPDRYFPYARDVSSAFASTLFLSLSLFFSRRGSVSVYATKLKRRAKVTLRKSGGTLLPPHVYGKRATKLPRSHLFIASCR